MKKPFNPASNNRTVRTLLLCRVNPTGQESYKEVYREIYSGSSGKGDKYISVGNVDCFSLYDTLQRSSQKTDAGWFREIYEDRKRIIHNTKHDRSYHPIHLVSNRSYHSDKYHNNPFCIVTLIYGVKNKKSEEGEIEEGELLSQYEITIEGFLKDIIHKNPSETNIPSYEIYNAVNICDAVVIWYTNDIISTLAYSNEIGRQGFARKTYTIVGLLTDENGNIDSSARETLEKDKSSQSFHVRLQGSIRNQGRYDELEQSIRNEFPNQAIESYTVFGSADHTITISNMSGSQFAALIQHYIDNTTFFNNACWEAHTELLNKGERGGAPAEPPSCLLDALLKKYEKLILGKDNAATPLKFPWFDAFYELLSVHANIDHHPILHGPSHLFFDYIDILYKYLSDEKNDEIFKRSYVSIQDGIQGWSMLTDQLLRIDDFTFHGFGNGSVLYNTLPACALDFYHSFLHQIIDILVKIDKIDGRISNPSQYQYDFIMLPEMNQRVAIVPMLDLDYKPDRKAGKRVLSPSMQVFLVYFPIETVFSPFDFFTKLLHECFHHFGDAFRLREARKEKICKHIACAYVSSCVEGNWDIDECPEEQRLFDYVLHTIMNAFQEREPNGDEVDYYLRKGMRDILSDESRKKLYTIIGRQILSDFTNSNDDWDILNPEGSRLFETIISILNDEKGISGFYSTEGLGELSFKSRLDYRKLKEGWESSKNKRGGDNIAIIDELDSNELIGRCIYFFKECFADLMMVLFLGIDTSDYLTLWDDDLFKLTEAITKATSNEEDKMRKRDATKEMGFISQRIALVLAAQGENITSSAEYFSVVVEIARCLNDPSKEPVYDSEVAPFICSLGELIHIKNYLCDVKKQFNEMYSIAKEKIDSIRTTFGNVFYDGEFMNRGFFDIISLFHKEQEKRA